MSIWDFLTFNLLEEWEVLRGKGKGAGAPQGSKVGLQQALEPLDHQDGLSKVVTVSQSFARLDQA